MQLPRSSPSQSGWTLSQTRCYWAGVASVTRNVCLTEPTPGSASHLVPITPLITHVSGCLGSSGGNACWGEEARLLLTVGDDTGCPVCSLGPEWSPGAEQSRGLENKEPGTWPKRGRRVAAGRDSTRLLAMGTSSRPLLGWEERWFGIRETWACIPVIYCSAMLGKSPYLSEHVFSSTKWRHLNLLHRVRIKEIICEKAHQSSNSAPS